MDFGISTSCFGTTPLTPDLLERVRRAAFSAIELHAVLPGFNYHNRSEVRSIARWFGDVSFPLHPFTFQSNGPANRSSHRATSNVSVHSMK